MNALTVLTVLYLTSHMLYWNVHSFLLTSIDVNSVQLNRNSHFLCGILLFVCGFIQILVPKLMSHVL